MLTFRTFSFLDFQADLLQKFIYIQFVYYLNTCFLHYHELYGLGCSESVRFNVTLVLEITA
jgi:hypothetical protein